MSGAVETFRTYANYIRAFAQLAGFPPFTIGDRRLQELAARIGANLELVEPQAGVDLPRVRSSLINAWGTEMILNITMTYAQEDEIVGLTNDWAAVQLYYAAYHATQALLLARGYQRPESHSQTQRMFADLRVMRNANLPPWSLGVGSDGVMNGPGRDIDFAIHPWSGCSHVTCWDLGAKAIRTTREDAVTNAITRARHQKQKELRIKTNYEDAAVFVDGPESPAQARFVRRDFAYVTAATLLLNEIHIQSNRRSAGA